MTTTGNLEQLVERARTGDSKAWGTIYEDLAPLVFRLCRRLLSSREDAEDATAEVFLKARLHLGQVDTSRPFRPWLFKVAANHCWDELRKRRTRAPLDETEGDIEQLSDGAPNAQEAILADQSRAAIREGIRGLDDRARTALVLRYYGEMPYQAIAEVLGVSSNFVGVLLFRARRELRRRLEGGNLR